jgi:hypothetical protein
MRPRRRASKAPLLVIPLVLVLILGVAGAIGGFVYFTEVRPKEFLAAWGREIGTPQGMSLEYGGTVAKQDGRHAYQAWWRVTCGPGYPCDNPSPPEAVAEWLSRAGDGGLNERQVAECFTQASGSPCRRTLFKEGHQGMVEIYRYLPNQFDVKVNLYW